MSRSVLRVIACDHLRRAVNTQFVRGLVIALSIGLTASARGQWVRPWLFAWLALVLPAGVAGAQEAWCVANPTVCQMSETFQSTSYTVTQFDSAARQWLGDQTGSKPGFLNKPFEGTASIGTNVTGGANCIGASGCELRIATDASILALLPNRDTSAVARYMAMTNVGSGGTPRFGYAPLTSLPSNIRRLGFRWYAYYDPGHSWTVNGGSAGNCNAKIAHNNGPGGWAQPPLATLSTLSTTSLHLYTINDAGWLWDGHTGIDGFASPPGPGGSPGSWNGKWNRHELTIRNPRFGDTGYDLEFRTTDVTTPGATTHLDLRMSNGCTNCMFDSTGVISFVWDSSFRTTADAVGLHTEYYRSSCSNTVGGFLYAAVAWWPTDVGDEFIGAASEIEGGAAASTARMMAIVGGVVPIIMIVGIAVLRARVHAS